MARRKKCEILESDQGRQYRKALTPESREQQLINLAVNCAEQQLRDGTASSQVITHYLKLATEKEKLEREKMELENKLLIAKTEKIESDKRVEELYKEALEAMRNYGGND